MGAQVVGGKPQVSKAQQQQLCAAISAAMGLLAQVNQLNANGGIPDVNSKRLANIIANFSGMLQRPL